MLLILLWIILGLLEFQPNYNLANSIELNLNDWSKRVSNIFRLICRIFHTQPIDVFQQIVLRLLYIIHVRENTRRLLEVSMTYGCLPCIRHDATTVVWKWFLPFCALFYRIWSSTSYHKKHKSFLTKLTVQVHHISL